MYQDTILKLNNLRQTHTNTIWYTFEKKLYNQIQNIRENFSVKYFAQKCKVKLKKKLKSDVLERALDQ